MQSQQQTILSFNYATQAQVLATEGRRLLEDGLDFNRFTLYQKNGSKLAIPQTMALINKIETFLDQLPASYKTSLMASNTQLIDILNNLCKKVSLYHAFLVGDRNEAIKYIDKYKHWTSSNTLEQAEVFMLCGFANLLDSNYKDPSDLQKALTAYENLQPNDPSEHRDIQLGKAFILRYLGLLANRNHHIDLALACIDQAITLQAPYLLLFPVANMDLADALHIRGLVLSGQNRFEEAEEALNQALSKWDELEYYLGQPHPCLFSSLALLMDVFFRQNKEFDVLDLVEQFTKKQAQSHENNPNNMDAADLKHLAGTMFLNFKLYEIAIRFLESSLKIKKQICSLNAVSIEKTEQTLKVAQKKLSQTASCPERLLFIKPPHQVRQEAPLNASLNQLKARR